MVLHAMNTMMRKILLLLLLIPFYGETQNWFQGATWNYHFIDYTSWNNYYHLGSCTTIKDTLINAKTFSVIKDEVAPGKDRFTYLREENKVVYYWYENEELKLFDFSKSVGDSFQIDFYYDKYPEMSIEIIKNGWIKIDTIRYIFNLSRTDSLRTFYYTLLSSDFATKGVVPTTPFEVINPITEKILLLHTARYFSLNPIELFNGHINTGSATKPILTCYENSLTGFNYKDSTYLKNNYSCTYNTGINNMVPQHSISFYPNPASSMLYVNAVGVQSVVLLNTLGKTMKRLLLNEPETAIDMDDLPPACYFICFYDKDEMLIQTATWLKE